MTKENIIEFLRIGQLANFPFGTFREMITDALGSTSWMVPISSKDKRPAILKYDYIEFYFNEDDRQKLYGIQFTSSQPADKKGLEIEYHDLKEKLDYLQMKNFLEKNNITYEESISDYESDTRVIRTEGQVTLYFHNDNMIEKFGRFVKSNSVIS